MVHENGVYVLIVYYFCKVVIKRIKKLLSVFISNTNEYVVLVQLIDDLHSVQVFIIEHIMSYVSSIYHLFALKKIH